MKTFYVLNLCNTYTLAPLFGSFFIHFYEETEFNNTSEGAKLQTWFLCKPQTLPLMVLENPVCLSAERSQSITPPYLRDLLTKGNTSLITVCVGTKPLPAADGDAGRPK